MSLGILLELKGKIKIDLTDVGMHICEYNTFHPFVTYVILVVSYILSKTSLKQPFTTRPNPPSLQQNPFFIYLQ